MELAQGSSRRFRVVLGLGTRPEAIKLGPVFIELRKNRQIEALALLTGQHEEQLEQALSLFGIGAAANLHVMTRCQELPELAGRMIPSVAQHLRDLEADYVLVQGDALSTFVVAWAAHLERIPVGHVEAGLRTFDLFEPFPEEANRRLTDVISDLYLVPTSLQKKNLLREGADPERILITGQTGVDAVLRAARRGVLPASLPPGRYVTVTLHRRESWPSLGFLAGALRRLAEHHPTHTFVFPVHLNPVVRDAVQPILAEVENFHLLDPLEYGSMAALLAQSELIITDSGGLQEEGTTLGVPVLVVRNVTERPEGLGAGTLELAGTNPNKVFQLATRLLKVNGSGRVPAGRNPYGDGRAANRVARAVAWRLGIGERPLDWREPGAATEPRVAPPASGLGRPLRQKGRFGSAGDPPAGGP